MAEVPVTPPRADHDEKTRDQEAPDRIGWKDLWVEVHGMYPLAFLVVFLVLAWLVLGMTPWGGEVMSPALFAGGTLAGVLLAVLLQVGFDYASSSTKFPWAGERLQRRLHRMVDGTKQDWLEIGRLAERARRDWREVRRNTIAQVEPTISTSQVGTAVYAWAEELVIEANNNGWPVYDTTWGREREHGNGAVETAFKKYRSVPAPAAGYFELYGYDPDVEGAPRRYDVMRKACAKEGHSVRLLPERRASLPMIDFIASRSSVVISIPSDGGQARFARIVSPELADVFVSYFKSLQEGALKLRLNPANEAEVQANRAGHWEPVPKPTKA